MLKKAITFIMIGCFLTHHAGAQNLMHGFGSTISAMFGKITGPYSSSSFALQQTSLTYFPRYNFVENEGSSVSIGFPVSGGIGIASDAGHNDAGLYFSYDLPVVLDYNMGCKSTSDNEDNFGGYVGAGFGYNKVSISQSQYSDYKGASYGPLVRAGVRVGSSKESWEGRAITVGVYYKKGLEKNKLNTIGFNVLYDL